MGHVPPLLAFFTPQSGGSPNANHIHSLYEITLYIGLAVFVLVEGALAARYLEVCQLSVGAGRPTMGSTRSRSQSTPSIESG